MRAALPNVLVCIAVAASCLGTLSPCHAQRGRVEADPNKEYYPTIDLGPWMICAASYSGPEGRELARQMALQIRSQNNMPAFMFQHINEDQKRRAEEREKLQQMHPQANIPKVKVEEFWAVMVGGYGSPEEARRVLDEVKKMKPPELKLASGAPTTDQVLQLVPRPDKGGYEVQKAPVNPFATAFVARNPAVKAEPAKDPAKEEQFIKSLNWGRPYSLYSCKKPFTLVVKDYGGANVTQNRSASGAFFNMLTLGKVGDVLDAGGKQAEEVARGLRELKYEAYVLHRRYDSLVTVGGFDGPDDPALLQLQGQLRKMRLGWIEFYANPAPMPVPHS